MQASLGSSQATISSDDEDAEKLRQRVAMINTVGGAGAILKAASGIAELTRTASREHSASSHRETAHLHSAQLHHGEASRSTKHTSSTAREGPREGARSPIGAPKARGPPDLNEVKSKPFEEGLPSLRQLAEAADGGAADEDLWDRPSLRPRDHHLGSAATAAGEFTVPGGRPSHGREGHLPVKMRILARASVSTIAAVAEMTSRDEAKRTTPASRPHVTALKREGSRGRSREGGESPRSATPPSVPSVSPMNSFPRKKASTRKKVVRRSPSPA